MTTDPHRAETEEQLKQIRAKVAAERQAKPATNGAASPGLVWRTSKDGMRSAVWVARADLVKRGFAPAAVQLWSSLAEPTAEERSTTAADAQIQQDRMLAWERTNGAGAKPAQPARPEPPPANRTRMSVRGRF